MKNPEDQISLLLQRIHNGDRKAESELLPLVYGCLHNLTERHLRSERNGHTHIRLL